MVLEWDSDESWDTPSYTWDGILDVVSHILDELSVILNDQEEILIDLSDSAGERIAVLNDIDEEDVELNDIYSLEIPAEVDEIASSSSEL